MDHLLLVLDQFLQILGLVLELQIPVLCFGLSSLVYPAVIYELGEPCLDRLFESGRDCILVTEAKLDKRPLLMLTELLKLLVWRFRLFIYHHNPFALILDRPSLSLSHFGLFRCLILSRVWNEHGV